MFFSSVLFTKRGNLAKVWLAAHHQDKRLTKAVVVSTDIEECSHELSEPKVPLSLRISGQLLLGVVRIYQRKVRYLQEDTQEALTKMRMSSRPGSTALELHPSHATASSSHITFLDSTENDFLDFAIPDIPLNRLEEICQDGYSQQEMGRAQDMMLEPDGDRFSYNLSVDQGAKQFEGIHDVLMTGEEDMIQMEPFENGDDRLDHSVELGRDAQDYDVDVALLPLDIDYEEPIKDGDMESIIPAAHGDISEEPISLIEPLNDNLSIVGNDQSVLGSVDLVQELGGEINVAVKKSRKRKRVKHDRSIQISSAEVMSQDISHLVAKRAEFVLQSESNLLSSAWNDTNEWLIAQSEVTGPLAKELCDFMANSFKTSNPGMAIESDERPDVNERSSFDEPGNFVANISEDNLKASEVEMDSQSHFNEDPPLFDEEMPIPEQDSGSRVDGDDQRQFEENFISTEPLDVLVPGAVDEPLDPVDEETSQSGTFSSWSDRTKKMCMLLSERLDKPNTDLTLQSLLEGKSRSTAAIIFLETLILKTHDFIDLDQQQPYGDITITQASRVQDGVSMADMVAITG